MGKMVIDPVCKMTVEERNAAASSLYKGTTYHFCSKACKKDFDENPESFIHPPADKSSPANVKVTSEMAKDPICGMVVPKDRSIKRESGGRVYYFCRK